MQKVTMFENQQSKFPYPETIKTRIFATSQFLQYTVGMLVAH